MTDAKEKNILFINACVRQNSRTLRLARKLLSLLEGSVRELRLEQVDLRPLNGKTLALRDDLLRQGKTDHPLLRWAREFAAADMIVAAAPCWDLSFPALIKIYFEQITVNGVTFSYDETGHPFGLCRAEKLFYVTTAGGPLPDPEHGYSYVRDLAGTFYGIPETFLFSAEMLDVVGMDVERLLRDAEARIENALSGNAAADLLR